MGFLGRGSLKWESGGGAANDDTVVSIGKPPPPTPCLSAAPRPVSGILDSFPPCLSCQYQIDANFDCRLGMDPPTSQPLYKRSLDVEAVLLSKLKQPLGFLLDKSEA